MPKKRRRIGIKWKMFFILFCFVSLFTFVVWIFQIQMLHYFYQGAKYGELKDVSKKIVSTIGDERVLTLAAETYSKEYFTDIWIYRTENKEFKIDNRVLHSDGTGDSSGYYIESNFEALYNKAVSNRGN